jgi:RHS repeat-associated protein
LNNTAQEYVDICPFRYKGYYYDSETALYSLHTRYYNSVVGRFINVDSQIAGVNGDNLGKNAFAYCKNNAVNSSDPSGNWPRLITAAVAVAATAIAVVATVVCAPAIAVTAGCVGSAAGCVLALQTLHYDVRQSHNTNLPETAQDAETAGWRNSNERSDENPNGGGPKALCHQFSAPRPHDPSTNNIKYVSPDGKREAIYDYNGNMVTDPRDIGTYNFSPSGSILGSIGHFCFDMLPWLLFGNNDEDWGPLIDLFTE